VSTTIQDAVNIVDPSFNVFKDVLQECMGIVNVSDHSQLLLAFKIHKDREQKINHVVIVTKELNVKQVSLKDTEKKLANVVHAAADAYRAIRHVINQPSNPKKNNPSKKQRQIMKKKKLLM